MEKQKFYNVEVRPTLNGYTVIAQLRNNSFNAPTFNYVAMDIDGAIAIISDLLSGRLQP